MSNTPAGLDVTKALKTALADARRANRTAADDDFVRRVNDRVDAAYGLRASTMAEVILKFELILESDGDAFDHELFDAIRSNTDDLKRITAA